MFHGFALWSLNDVLFATVDHSGYGFRTLLEKKCADVLQPDVSVQYCSCHLRYSIVVCLLTLLIFAL